MEHTYELIGMSKADIANDRSRFALTLETGEGPIVLKVKANQLDALITSLQGVEYHATLLDPLTGRKPGEQVQVRTEIVHNFEVGNGMVERVPSVVICFNIAGIVRYFALNTQLARRLQTALQSEIPKLGPEISH